MPDRPPACSSASPSSEDTARYELALQQARREATAAASSESERRTRSALPPYPPTSGWLPRPPSHRRPRPPGEDAGQGDSVPVLASEEQRQGEASAPASAAACSLVASRSPGTPPSLYSLCLFSSLPLACTHPPPTFSLARTAFVLRYRFDDSRFSLPFLPMQRLMLPCRRAASCFPSCLNPPPVTQTRPSSSSRRSPFTRTVRRTCLPPRTGGS